MQTILQTYKNWEYLTTYKSYEKHYHPLVNKMAMGLNKIFLW